MAGLVDIFRLAMGHLDDRPIMDPGEQTLQAKLCRQSYPFSRDYMLRRAPWTFASARKELSSNGEPAFGWIYQSQLPTDYMRVNRLTASREKTAPQIKFEIEGSLILTDFSPIYLVYGRKVVNTGEFDPMFTQAVAAFLAFTIGGALGVPSTKIQQAGEAYRAFINEGEMVDSTQSDQDPPDEGSWLESRGEPSYSWPRSHRTHP